MKFFISMDNTKKFLFDFIKSSLWDYQLNESRLNGLNLSALYHLAEKQTVIGIVANGLSKNGIFDHCTFSEKMQWITAVTQIESNNERHQDVLGKTIRHLKTNNIPAVFMKGLIAGSRYPNPNERQCGDIDFVVAEHDFDKTLDALDQIGKVNRSLIHEHHGMAFVDSVTLEPHYKVHNFQNPKVDRVMKDLFSKVFPEGTVYERIGNIDVPTFPPAFECAVLVGHMVNHIFAEGLGIRQVIDFMMFLDKKYTELDKDECLFYLKQLQMERAFRIFARICEKYLGLSEQLLALSYTPKESVFADKLMEDIIRVGNFGRGENYLGKIKVLRPLRSYLWVAGRCFKLGYLCPAEAKWWPISKVQRFFWKKQIAKLA